MLFVCACTLLINDMHEYINLLLFYIIIMAYAN